MKPLHCTLGQLRRCPCCQSRYSKKNGGPRYGKKAARARAKLEIKKEVRGT